MLLPLFLLFTLMPLLELWLLFKLSGLFGFFRDRGDCDPHWHGWCSARALARLASGLLAFRPRCSPARCLRRQWATGC